jgi:hypothetical protein
MWNIAEEFGALIVFAEHRFYGTSMPYGNNSYDFQNINYLTSEQALADYVYLIEYIKISREIQTNPVVAFGGRFIYLFEIMNYSNTFKNFL